MTTQGHPFWAGSVENYRETTYNV